MTISYYYPAVKLPVNVAISFPQTRLITQRFVQFQFTNCKLFSIILTIENICFQFEFSIIVQATCPATWDGWQCWPHDTTPGVTAQRPCPQYIHFLTYAGHNGVGCQSIDKIKYLCYTGRLTVIVQTLLIKVVWPQVGMLTMGQETSGLTTQAVIKQMTLS